MIESAIIEGVENKDLVTAGAGLIGVLVGGIITTVGQTAARKHEYRQRVLEQVTELCSAAYDYSNNADSQLTLLGIAPKDVINEHSRRVNDAFVTVTKRGNSLSVLAGGPIKKASVKVVNSVVMAQDYLHPALGDGRNEGFVLKDQLLGDVDSARNLLIDLAGRHWLSSRLTYFWERR